MGAHGFLGSFIAAALRARGWRVIVGVRKPSAGTDERRVDLTCMQGAESWRAILADVDIVAKAFGILYETAQQKFETIHVSGYSG